MTLSIPGSRPEAGLSAQDPVRRQSMATPGPSITSSESFLARAQRSEERRVKLWLCVLVGMVVVTVARRVAHGVVMSANAAFFPTLGILITSIAFQVILLFVLRRANRAMKLLPERVWRASAVFDMIVPAAVLAILQWTSPRGAVAALSGPSLLLMPIVVLTSVLRLRPMF